MPTLELHSRLKKNSIAIVKPLKIDIFHELKVYFS